MSSVIVGILSYALIPVLATSAGSVVAAYRPPGPRFRSAVQHFAAGVVFAAVAGELLPEAMHDRAPIPIIIGFAVGVLTMLGIKVLTRRIEERDSSVGSLPTGLLAAVGIDLLLDGLLVGIGFTAGAAAGLLITIALTLEVLFLGLSTAASLAQAHVSTGRVIGMTTGLALLILVGALLGATLLAGLSGFALDLVLAFGVAALLYLVTEELLVEAHAVPETLVATTMFFLGFLVILVLELVV